MNNSDKSIPVSKMANLESVDSMNKKNKAELQAVEEMSKHLLSVEQKREQIKQTHWEADRHEKRK